MDKIKFRLIFFGLIFCANVCAETPFNSIKVVKINQTEPKKEWLLTSNGFIAKRDGSKTHKWNPDSLKKNIEDLVQLPFGILDLVENDLPLTAEQYTLIDHQDFVEISQSGINKSKVPLASSVNVVILLLRYRWMLEHYYPEMDFPYQQYYDSLIEQIGEELSHFQESSAELQAGIIITLRAASFMNRRDAKKWLELKRNSPKTYVLVLNTSLKIEKFIKQWVLNLPSLKDIELSFSKVESLLPIEKKLEDTPSYVQIGHYLFSGAKDGNKIPGLSEVIQFYNQFGSIPWDLNPEQLHFAYFKKKGGKIEDLLTLIEPSLQTNQRNFVQYVALLIVARENTLNRENAQIRDNSKNANSDNGSLITTYLENWMEYLNSNSSLIMWSDEFFFNSLNWQSGTKLLQRLLIRSTLLVSPTDMDKTKGPLEESNVKFLNQLWANTSLTVDPINQLSSFLYMRTEVIRYWTTGNIHPDLKLEMARWLTYELLNLLSKFKINYRTNEAYEWIYGQSGGYDDKNANAQIRLMLWLIQNSKSRKNPEWQKRFHSIFEPARVFGFETKTSKMDRYLKCIQSFISKLPFNK